MPKSRWFISPSGAMGWVDPSVGSGRDFAVFCGSGRVEILQFFVGQVGSRFCSFLWVRSGRDFAVFCGLGRVEILQFFVGQVGSRFCSCLWVRLGRDFSVFLVGWVGLGPL